MSTTIEKITTSMYNQYNCAHATIQSLDDFFKYIYFPKIKNSNLTDATLSISKKNVIFDTESNYKCFYTNNVCYSNVTSSSLNPLLCFAGLIEQKQTCLSLPIIIATLKLNQLPAKLPLQLKKNILSFQLLNIQLLLDTPKEFMCCKSGIEFLQKKQFGQHLFKFLLIQRTILENIDSIEKISGTTTKQMMPHEIYNEAYLKIKEKNLIPSDSLNEKYIGHTINYELMESDIKKFVTIVTKNGQINTWFGSKQTIEALKNHKEYLETEISLLVNTDSNED